MKKFNFFDENTNKNYYFNIISVVENEDILVDKIFDEIEIQDLENKYGIHDVSFDSSDCIFGFTSYEIEGEKYLELMYIWKDFFNRNNLLTSDVLNN